MGSYSLLYLYRLIFAAFHRSLSATRFPLLATRHALSATRYALLATRHALLATRHPPRVTRHSLSATRHALLATRHPPPALKGAATYHSRPPLCIARTNILDRTEDHDGYVTTLQRILYPLPTEDETFFRGGKDYFLVDERL